MSKNIYRRRRVSRVRIGGAGVRRKCQTVSYAAENCSVFRCALKVVTQLSW